MEIPENVQNWINDGLITQAHWSLLWAAERSLSDGDSVVLHFGETRVKVDGVGYEDMPGVIYLNLGDGVGQYRDWSTLTAVGWAEGAKQHARTGAIR